MRLRTQALLEDHLFGQVVDDVRRILNLSYKEMERRVGIHWERIRHFKTKGTRVTRDEFRDCIVPLIEQSGHPGLSAYLECKYPSIFGAGELPAYPAEIALAQWVEAPEQSSTSFYKKCVKDSRGRFLLMRRDDEGKLVCALMRVNPPATRHSLATFNTIRFMSNGLKRKTNGVIFELHSRIYAIGRLDGLQGLRFSNLHIQERGSRSDLFGIRLGILRGSGQTFASRLYAYQIRRTERAVRNTPGILPRILQPWHPDENPDLASSILGFKAIYAMLEPGPLLDNGITVPV